MLLKRRARTLLTLFLLVGLAPASRLAGQSLPAGLTYVWWDFGVKQFEDFQIDITIHNDLETRPGMYFQMYQGRIGDTGFYFGIQTDVYKPREGGKGKGLIFSRWGSRSLKDVRAASDGWVQSAGYEGDFVGVRKPYAWTNHRYRLRLTALDHDQAGVWYGFFILDYDTGKEDYCGAIRFNYGPDGSRPKIQNGGVTWTEIYSGAAKPSDLPDWHVSIDRCSIEQRSREPVRATSDYSKVPGTDIAYDESTGQIHFRIGKDVKRQHPKGPLYTRPAEPEGAEGQ